MHPEEPKSEPEPNAWPTSWPSSRPSLESRLEAIYEKLEKMDPTTFEKRVGELLFGLGFSQTMMARMTKDMSGGWRMRVALAQESLDAPRACRVELS